MSLDIFRGFDWGGSLLGFVFCFLSGFLILWVLNNLFVRFFWSATSSLRLVSVYGGGNFSYSFIFLVFTRMFWRILLLKISSILPLVYCVSLFFNLVIFFRLILWGRIVLTAIIRKISTFFSMFCPEGSPLELRRRLSVIELVRKVLRPFTLRLRLGINITTGHVIFSLLRSVVLFLVLSKSWFSLRFLRVLSVFLVFIFFEVFVGFIQRLVYVLLLNNYFSE